LELWNTDTYLGHTLYADMVARLHSFLISANGLQIGVVATQMFN